MSEILTLRDITKSYYLQSETIDVLRGVNLTVREGDFVGIFGPSGSGKSTLLNIIGSLDRPTSGTVDFDGMDLAEHDDVALSEIRNKQIGFVFQFHHLLSEFTCLENVALPGLLDCPSPRLVHEKAQHLLEKFGMADKRNRLPEQLSGGERQRVAIARALINDPLLLLADEPAGNLDDMNTNKLLEVFVSLNSEGKTVMLVTHSLDVEKFGTHVYNLREGRLYVM